MIVTRLIQQNLFASVATLRVLFFCISDHDWPMSWPGRNFLTILMISGITGRGQSAPQDF